MTGYVLKRSDTDYVVNYDAQSQCGYNVVPKELDSANAYTIAEVEAYLSEHPDMLLDMTAIEADQTKKEEMSSLKSYLSSTDYIYPKCLELGLDVNEVYGEVVQKRKDARVRIQELEAQA